MFKVQPLGAAGALLVLICAAGCGGSHVTTLPAAGVQPNEHANSVVTSRSRKFATAFRTAMRKTPEQNIADAAAQGARVFRVPSILVYDPASHLTLRVPARAVRRTPNGIVLFEGPHSIALSHAAKISAVPQSTYLFVRGPQSDPDAASGAVRIR
jgi:hypothetical protein